jgi:DNA-binding LytR/AlgR family response regulator
LPKNQKEFCFIKSGYKSEKVFYKDILYIEGQKEYIYIHTKEKKYVKLQSMSSFMTELPDDEFIRIHKSYIVAAGKINAIYGNTVEIGQISLPVGRSYKDLVQKLITPN